MLQESHLPEMGCQAVVDSRFAEDDHFLIECDCPGNSIGNQKTTEQVLVDTAGSSIQRDS